MMSSQMEESILNLEQRRLNGYLGQDEDPGELAFRRLCKLMDKPVYRQGWRGKDEEHPGMREFDAVSRVQMYAPDFRTDNSYMEVQFVNTADHIKIKDSKLKILTKWWDNCLINPHGDPLPLNWMFYQKQQDKIVMVCHEFIKGQVAKLEKVSLFPGNKADERKKGYKIPLDAFTWMSMYEFIDKSRKSS